MKVRDVFANFEVYGWETPTYEIAKETGLKSEQIERLDTNTSPYRPKGALEEVVRKLTETDVNQYPDTSYRALTKGLAKYTGKELERFVVTNGADEGLDIISKVVVD